MIKEPTPWPVPQANAIAATAIPAVQPALRAAAMPLFPTLETLQSVVDLANSQIPAMYQNMVLGLLMTYHNTLLKVIKDE